MKEFIYATLASESFKKYVTVIRDMEENEARISMAEICRKRDKYANMIINETGTKDASREDAFEFTQQIYMIRRAAVTFIRRRKINILI